MAEGRRLARCGLAAGAILFLAGCGGAAFDDFDLPDAPSLEGPKTREHPDIALADNGKATCVWVGDNHIYAERFIPGYGWTDSTQIDALPDEAGQPQVAMDPVGDAVVVWEQDGQIVANCFEVGSGWRGAESISEPGAPPAGQPQVGSAEDGTTVVAWEQDGSVVATTLDPATGWQDPVEIAVPVLPASNVSLDVTSGGDAVVAWDEGDVEVVAASLDGSAGTWSPPAVLGAGSTPQVAADEQGGVVVVFEQADEVAAVVHDPLDGWQPPAAVPVPPALDELPATRPQVDLAPDGEGLILVDIDGEVHASIIEPGAEPSVVTPIAPLVPVSPVTPAQVAVDAEGNGLVVFADVDGHVQTVAFRDAYEQWMPPKDHGVGTQPVVDVDPDGGAVSVFIEDGGIGAVRIDDLDPTLPVRLELRVQGGGAVTSDAPGLACSADSICRTKVPMGTVVLIRAQALPGFRFEHWSVPGLGVDTRSAIEVVATHTQSIEAVFVPVP